MKKQLFTIAAGLSLAAMGLMGQGRSIGAFQQAGTMGRGGAIMIPLDRGSQVTGTPFTAQEVNKTVQTLSDGTVLENTRNGMLYRDSQGRTRTEPPDSGGRVVIVDFVAGFRITLNPSAKTADRMPLPAGGTGPRGGAAPLAELEAAAVPREVRRSGVTSNEHTNTEDLGLQTQNGVLAQGTRITLTIPKGQIGNNRDIHVVNERWYSKDLHMVVKSVNSDPRFGVTTYELTNIVQSADPSLFQVPAGYTVTDLAAGMGRGGR